MVASKNQDKIIALVTGANQGIGLELARKLLTSTTVSYHVLVSGRDGAKVRTAVEALSKTPGLTGTVEALRMDVTDPADITAAAESVHRRHGRIDILVHNAAIYRTAQGLERYMIFRESLRINTVGPLIVTEAFLPVLKAPFPDSLKSVKEAKKRVVFVSSTMGSITRAANASSSYGAVDALEYRASKAGLNMVMVQMHARLKDEGILVFGADPGLVITGITGDAEDLRQRGGVEPQVGGERLAAVVRGDRDADVGKVCGPDGEVVPF